MKKLLLATVAFALIAPAAQAEIKLDLGGFFKGYAGYANNDDAFGASPRKIDIKRKSQVFFTGETTLDNGLTVGYNGQLMQESSQDAVGAADTDAKLEQSYLYFSGNWGRVNLGRENGAAYLLQVTAPAADANLDGADSEFSFFNQNGLYRQEYSANGGFGAAAGGENFQYADKITYLTPKFNGFQAGVSYTPEATVKSYTNYFGQSLDNDGDLEQLLEAGARYDGEFSGVGVHVGGGYTQADAEIAAVNDDYKEWNTGAKLTYEGFGFGAAYTKRTADAGLGAAEEAKIKTWVAGVDYTYGAYTFGASYLNSKGSEETNTGKDKYDRYAVGAGYTFGPGMKFNGSVALHDENLGIAGATGGNSATVVAIGTDIQF